VENSSAVAELEAELEALARKGKREEHQQKRVGAKGKRGSKRGGGGGGSTAAAAAAAAASSASDDDDVSPTPTAELPHPLGGRSRTLSTPERPTAEAASAAHMPPERRPPRSRSLSSPISRNEGGGGVASAGCGSGGGGGGAGGGALDVSDAEPPKLPARQTSGSAIGSAVRRLGSSLAGLLSRSQSGSGRQLSGGSGAAAAAMVGGGRGGARGAEAEESGGDDDDMERRSGDSLSDTSASGTTTGGSTSGPVATYNFFAPLLSHAQDGEGDKGGDDEDGPAPKGRFASDFVKVAQLGKGGCARLSHSSPPAPPCALALCSPCTRLLTPLSLAATPAPGSAACGG
jgi:hypothetical protein